MNRGKVLALFAILLLTDASACASREDNQIDDSQPKTEKALLIRGRVQILDTGDKHRLPRPGRENAVLPSLHKQNHAGVGAASKQSEFSTGAFPLTHEWSKSFCVIRKKNDKGKIAPLAEKELSRLSNYDISILIDRSASMNEELDRFQMGAKISRWEWCRQQAESLSKQIASAFPLGITLIPFSNHAERYTNVSPAALNKIFYSTDPQGSTMLDEAVGLELDHYLFSRSTENSKKPLLMVVITDGSPNDPQRVVDKILHASRKINPGEIHIVFFMIGSDPMANAFVDYIRTSRIAAGISFDIVRSLGFAELKELGLARSLATAIESTAGVESKAQTASSLQSAPK